MDYIADYTSRQYIAHMLSLIGMSRKAARAITVATEQDLKIYVELIKWVSPWNDSLREMLEFSGVA